MKQKNKQLEEIYNTISHNIKTIRTAKELSQREFGILLGISTARIGSYEERRAIPPPHIVLELSNISGITINKLYTQKL